MGMERKNVTFLLIYVSTCCIVQATVISDTTVAASGDVIKVPSGGEGAEKEVLGPLRVWHIVFLVGLIVVIAVVIGCCCVEWRIPRTRQEIEETYRTRQMNQKYLRQLERTPDAVLARHNNVTDSHDSGTDRSQPRGARLADLQVPQNKKRPTPRQRQQQQQQQQHTGTSTATSGGRGGGGGGGGATAGGRGGGGGGGGGVSVAVTDTSARMARLAKSQMPQGVQSPFANLAAAALRKQGGQQRQQQT